MVVDVPEPVVLVVLLLVPPVVLSDSVAPTVALPPTPNGDAFTVADSFIAIPPVVELFSPVMLAVLVLVLVP